MASWIYIFSKFTPEALLFEALIICILCASYAAFWVLKKRKYGVLGKDVPNYAVKSYLSQLILDAEQMRIQLFGLLAGTGFDPNVMATLRAGAGMGAGMGAGATATAGGSPLLAALGVAGGAGTAASAAALAADPELGAKLAAIEAKMIEQAKAIEVITVEKVRVEKELTEARAGKGGGGGGDAAGNDSKLAEKIKALEAKLAEYSVIEDDLANLKRLQQENTQLKAQLGGKAVPLSEVAAATGEVNAGAAANEAAVQETASGNTLGDVPTEVPSAVVEAQTAEATPTEETAAAAEAVAATDAAISEAATAAPIAASTGDPGFEGLVDQVEQSLVEPNAPPAEAVAEPAAGASVADTAAPNGEVQEAAQVATSMTPTPEKTDADLVAEFEKMLNS